jgi:hypothetical protein
VLLTAPPQPALNATATPISMNAAQLMTGIPESLARVMRGRWSEMEEDFVSMERSCCSSRELLLASIALSLVTRDT